MKKPKLTVAIIFVLGLALLAVTPSTFILSVLNSKLSHQLFEANREILCLKDLADCTDPSTTTSPPPEAQVNYRLPDTLSPLNYELRLHPDLDTGNFTGDVTITIHCKKSTDEIILHSRDLNIKDVRLLSTETITVKDSRLEPLTEFLIIKLSKSLNGGQDYKLFVSFGGSMKNKIVGLYTSTYLTADQSYKTIAASKFEPTFARQAFPCFDEPQLKATFDIKLIHPSKGGYHALSNMDSKQSDVGEDYTEVTFNPSVKMSTYLVCFVISDFRNISHEITSLDVKNNFMLNVYAQPQQIEKVEFALDVGKSIIEYYIKYFGIEYPLPKLDMIAIPDFVSGAMENWGLVTYRETALLYDEKTSSSVSKQHIASVIAHEFAHMWFGNLVTMKWWNDLWLNEGFAKYIENKGVNSKFPEWKMLDQFLIDTLHGVMNLDATLGSHPIIQPVSNPDQITEIFDAITYSKGASVIRMLENFVGAAAFQEAVHNYLEKHQFNNTVTDDFLSEIRFKETNVKTVMKTWTEQSGLPVVSVETHNKTYLVLKQKRFFSNPEDYNKTVPPSPFHYKWTIPITFKTSKNEQVQQTWFHHNDSEIYIEYDSNNLDWIKFNSEQVGYYRVNYNEDIWKNLASKLQNQHDQFSIADRAGLLNDAFALADSTQLSYSLAMELTKYLKKETEYVPWTVAATMLLNLNNHLMFTDSYTDFRQYVLSILKDIYSTIEWNVNSDPTLHLQNRFQAKILNTACSFGMEECLKKASELFEKFVNDPSDRPHPDLRPIIYYFGMQEKGSDVATWDNLWDIYKDETDASEKVQFIRALSTAKEPWILKRFLEYAWSENNVRGQDYFTCLQNIASNPVGEPLVWDYVRENWPKLVARFGLNERNLGNLIPGITFNFHTQLKLNEMNNFFAVYSEAGAGTAARVRAQERVKNNIAWLENNVEKLSKWLKDANKMS